MRSAEKVLPYGLDGGAFAGEGGFVETVAGFVEAGDVLGVAQGAVGVGGGLACAGGQQGGGFGALQQGDVAEVGFELRVLAGVGEHEVLHAELASIMPPALCLMSNTPGGVAWAARILWRMAAISSRRAGRLRSAVMTAWRTASKRGASWGRPQT